MRLWKKVYILALVIITLCVNLGFYGIVYFTYNQMLEAEKERCQNEYVIMIQSLSRDIAKMEQSILLDEVYFDKFLMAYDSYYDDNIQIYGMINETIVGPEVITEVDLTKEGVFIYDEQQTNIYIVQTLDKNHEDYRVVMRKELIDFDKTWDTLLPLYLIGGIVLSLGVSLVLALVVRIVLKPMDRLSAATKQMQKGDWSTRVQIEGKNELSELGNQFNSMADAIEESVVKLEEQSRQKQELINNLAHEMNTPITSIQGFADYMKMSELSREEREEALNFIVRESKRLKDISSTLLSMVALQNEEELSYDKFGIKDLCCRLIELYAKQMEDKNIMFDIDCEIGEMKGNGVLIESYLRNMIANSMRALEDAENKKIQINIFTKGNMNYIQVKDNGCGIEEKHLKHIFEPFYRVDKARSRECGGSGLGLPFCKKIVELHNGQLEVESKVNEGTIFTATFTV